MRTITEHQINECNGAIELTADEPDEANGNASHHYTARWYERDESGMEIELLFQHGPIKEVGTNGITHEVLLAVLIDRLRGFQSGAYACDENRRALVSLMEARDALFERTKARVERGVEGTHQK